jgi:hypothetical protein
MRAYIIKKERKKRYENKVINELAYKSSKLNVSVYRPMIDRPMIDSPVIDRPVIDSKGRTTEQQVDGRFSNQWC